MYANQTAEDYFEHTRGVKLQGLEKHYYIRGIASDKIIEEY